ncbi:hypothetical protein [Ruegeria arenilitoris]|nr:hypothetical protein [Ruegeria arenilitoris]
MYDPKSRAHELHAAGVDREIIRRWLIPHVKRKERAEILDTLPGRMALAA